MSRPYLNVLNVGYVSPTMSVQIEYLKLRGGGTFSLIGASSSQVVISVTHSDAVQGRTHSFNVGTLSGSAAPGSTQLGTSSQYLYNGYIYFSKLGGVDSFTFSY